MDMSLGQIVVGSGHGGGDGAKRVNRYLAVALKPDEAGGKQAFASGGDAIYRALR